MYSISKACFNALNLPSRKMTARAAVTTSAGTVISLAASDFKQGGVRLSEATSCAGSFDLGAAVVSKLTLTLNNSDGRFNGVNFIGGQISSIQIGVTLSDCSVEWIPLGVFDIDSVKYSGTAAEVVGYDFLSRADKSLPSVSCPVTLGNLIRSVCTHCGIVWSGQSFLNDDYTVEKLPENSTCRDVISYAAALAGCYARMNRDAELIFGWYGWDMPLWGGEAWLDGGILIDATSGDSAHGGDFFDYNDHETDGGRNDFRSHCAIINPRSVSGDKPVTVTGVTFTEPDIQQSALNEEGNETVETIRGSTFICGTEEYCFDLSGNPLLTHDISDVLAALGEKLIGESFNPIAISCPSNPAFEAGDIVKVTDRRGIVYNAYVNRCEYKFGSPQRLSCEAKTLAEKSAEQFSYISRLERRIKSDTDAKISAYGSRLQALNNLILNSMGVYKTAVQSENGSVTYYTHDKPTLEASSYIACETSNGFAYTNSGWNEGSPVWQYGMTADGNIICNVLSAVGIIADWIQAGRIESADGSCYFDLDNNQLFANKIGLPTRYLSAGNVSTDSGENRAGIACYDENMSSSPYFQIRLLLAQSDDSLLGYGFADHFGRLQISCLARTDNHLQNAVIIYGWDQSDERHELFAANAASGGIRLSSMNGQKRIQITDNSITVKNGSKNVLETIADYTCIRNPGSNTDYWIAINDNGVSICRGDTVLQQWS